MIKIGTSGFSFKDWRGPVYPEALNEKDMLFYYSNELKFDTVEINFTYYALPSEKSFMGMQKRVNKDFIFTVKGFRGITHDPFDTRLKLKPTVKKTEEDIRRFVSALKPLIQEVQLGAVLLQFPYFFQPGEKSADYILKCKYMMKDIPLVIEFRNIDWAKEETLEFLKRNNLGFCAVDEPKLTRLMPYKPVVSSKTGYLRFHGRNKNWFNAPLEERYNYLYSDTELNEFIPDIKKMAGECEVLYLFFNNCHGGSAIKNAMKMREIITAIYD